MSVSVSVSPFKNLFSRAVMAGRNAVLKIVLSVTLFT
jgi:hypothetical protein